MVRMMIWSAIAIADAFLAGAAIESRDWPLLAGSLAVSIFATIKVVNDRAAGPDRN